MPHQSSFTGETRPPDNVDASYNERFFPQTDALANGGYTRPIDQNFTNVEVGLPNVQLFAHPASDMLHSGFSNTQHSSSRVVMPIASPRSLYLGTHSHSFSLNTRGSFHDVLLKPADPMPPIEEYQRSQISSVSARVNYFYKFLTHATSVYQRLMLNIPFISTKDSRR
jgi:hypothetical protein